MTLLVEIGHRLGDFAIDASFESAGRLTALFGPSGSGKSTLINLIAGLIRPERGRIAVDGRVLVDTDTGAFVPMHKRRIGIVFQDARLFPHLSVAGNLRYGRWFTPASERYADIDGVVDLLGIGHLLDRRPAKLSGGEKQRVAIGRALLASPKLLLMDEPMASLDEARKAEILPYVERGHRFI
ncbi:ATP-binding cassette domain-containing protein, partial [Mesorhizobium sp. M4A.F.Ca.ET.029.04.2.1]